MHYRALFISDIHLGAKGCKSKRLLQFLEDNTADKLYLVGDIIDFWKIRRKGRFSPKHVAVLQKLFSLSNSGVEIVYIIGNHDEVLRNWLPFQIGKIKLINQDIYHSKSGKRYLVIHGDQFDWFMSCAKIWMKIGDWLYDVTMSISDHLCCARNALGYSHWSLSAYLKANVKGAVKFISNYEQIVAETVLKENVDGIIVGHIHFASNKMIDNLHYLNCGDWVESCTAIAEMNSGQFEIIHCKNAIGTECGKEKNSSKL